MTRSFQDYLWRGEWRGDGGWARRRVLSDVFEEVADAGVEGFGNSPEGDEGDVFFAALDPAQVVRVQVGFLGQPFLGQGGALPLLTDGGANNDAVIRGRRHNLTRKQTLPPCSTPLNG